MNLNSPNLVRADRLAGLFQPAVVDIFAGCGGWSIGAEQAFVDGGYRDRYVDLMINHWETAVAVHQANHPLTLHLHADVLEVDPADVLPARRIAYLHASPDCTDFSKAKGSRPKRNHIRALADVVIVWAARRRPDVITLENVEEFKDWGPLREDGQPCPLSRGAEFRRWVGELEALGYRVEWRELRACDYGAPTTRKRLYVIARCDGKPIIWPEATHGIEGSNHADDYLQRDARSLGTGESAVALVAQAGAGVGAALHRDSEVLHRQKRRIVRRGDRGDGKSRLKPYRTAAECIDWSIPMLSIFATPDEARAFAQEHGVGIPRRPLKANTLRRIARGLMKYVLGARRPFLVNIQNYGWDSSPVGSVDRPLPTITGNPKGGAFALADVTVAPFCATLNHGGPESRANRLDRPLATVCGANDARAIVAAFLTTYYGNGGESSPADSLPTCTGHDRIGLVTALIDGQTYVVTDVAMRMLTPRELARAQGFPDDYVIDRDADGHPISKAYQVKLIGNSVCPPVARAIVRANVVEQGVLDDVMETAAA